jgi:type VI secretion system VasD/TssJ family lipoprotein
LKTCVYGLLLFCLIGTISSCSSVSRTPEYTYQRDAVTITLRADSQLNLYQGAPHTLVACTYQLRDPNAFNQLVDEKDGLPKLLECGRFDASVAYAKRLVIQPGQEIRDSLDRAEGAKYVSVVAGYYALKKGNAVRLFQIPVGTLSSKPQNVNIELYLGPQTIQDLKRR